MDFRESIRAPGRRANRARLAPAGACVLAGVLLALAGAAGANGPVATFVDATGTLNFTNRPHEPRYHRMTEIRSERNRAPRPPPGWPHDGIVHLAARQNDVPVALVKAVIAAESAFDPEAVSRKGAQGLMQLMPTTAAELGVHDPLHPDENVQGGVRYLRHLIDRYGDLSLALAAYNAGPNAVDRYGGVPPYRETKDYVKRVLTYYRNYHGDLGR